MVSDKNLITALGGARRLAEGLNVSRQAVVNWTRRGIPAHAWPLVKDYAAQRGVAVDEAKAIAASRRALARTRTRQVEESAA